MSKKKLGKMPEKFTEEFGTPTLMLLPARNYKFRVYEDKFVIKVPRNGALKDLDSEFFKDDDTKFEFLHYDEIKKTYMVPMSFISQILFATAQYPDLQDTQAFLPSALIIGEDEVTIIGKLIEMIEGEPEL